jgi:hypothetical protein
MNLDGDKLYMKIVAFIEIYNFLVQTFFIWSYLEGKKLIYYPDLGFQYPVLDSISFFAPQDYLKWKSIWTTKL